MSLTITGGGSMVTGTVSDSSTPTDIAIFTTPSSPANALYVINYQALIAVTSSLSGSFDKSMSVGIGGGVFNLNAEALTATNADLAASDEGQVLLGPNAAFHLSAVNVNGASATAHYEVSYQYTCIVGL